MKAGLRAGMIAILLTVGVNVTLAQTAETTETPEPVTCEPEGLYTSDLPSELTLYETIEEAPDGWQLVWNDEFDGDEIDVQKWGYDKGGSGFGNNELQYYTDRPENASVSDGVLTITAIAERYLGRDYSSAKLRTLGLADWRYGRFDIRAKLPYGQGIWPAFWMLPIQSKYGGWPSSGEIDIMEMVGHTPAITHGTLHYGESIGQHVYTGTYCTLSDGIFADDFHVFSVIWEPDSFTWYVDGVPFARQTDWHTGVADYPAPFDEYFYLILNLAVGGDWPGSPDETTEFPQYLTIDYVRVYQRDEHVPEASEE